jgi:hypothetical protein
VATFEEYGQGAVDAVVAAVRLVIGRTLDLLLIGLNLLRSTIPLTQSMADMLDSAIAGIGEFNLWLDTKFAKLITDGAKAAAVEVAKASGFELDPDDPFSEESINAAVSVKLGFPFENIFDAELLKQDLKKLAGEKIEEVTGIPMDLDDHESIGNFAAGLLIGAVKGTLSKIDVSAICPAVNTVAGVLCKAQNCHACMDDEEGCKAKREAQKKNRGKYQRECVRTPR